jgi:hypothetical protein
VNWFKKLSQAKACPPSGCRPPFRKTVPTPPSVKPEIGKTSKSTTPLPIQPEKSSNVLEQKKYTPLKESNPPIQNTQPAISAVIRTPVSKNLITVIEILDSSDDESEVKKNDSPILNNNGTDRKNNNDYPEKGRSTSSPVPIFYFKPEPLVFTSQLQSSLPTSGKEVNSDNSALLAEENEDFYYSQEVLYFEDDNNNQSFVYEVRKYFCFMILFF